MSEAILYDIIHKFCGGVGFHTIEPWSGRADDTIGGEMLAPGTLRTNGNVIKCKSCGDALTSHFDIRNPTLRDAIIIARKSNAA